MVKAIKILIADDNAADRMLEKEMLKETGFSVHIDEVTSGEDVLAYLKHEGRFAASPRPDLIILDMNMPKMGGGKLLKMADGLMDGIEVLVLSGSAPMEGSIGQDRHHLVKPASTEEFNSTLAVLKKLMNDLSS